MVRCATCGTTTQIPGPASAAPAQPVMAPAPAAGPAPVASQPPARRVWPWIVVGVVAVLLVAGTVVAFLPATRTALFPPSSDAVEERLVDGDARGDGGPYRVRLNVETGFIPVSLQVTIDPTKKETLMAFGGASQQQQGNLVALRNGTNQQLYRDYDPETKFQLPADAADERPEITSRDGRTYSGTTGTAAFTLQLDSSGRFQRLTITSTEGIGATLEYEYDNVLIPAFPSGAPRVPVDLSLPFPFEVEPDRRVDVSLTTMGETVRPDELEFRFLDNAQVVASVPFESTRDDGTYYFRWTDGNANGFVDEADSYAFEFQDPVDDVKVYDEWANAYVDSVERISVPGPGAALLLLALAGLVPVSRRRRA